MESIREQKLRYYDYLYSKYIKYNVDPVIYDLIKSIENYD